MTDEDRALCERVRASLDMALDAETLRSQGSLNTAELIECVPTLLDRIEALSAEVERLQNEWGIRMHEHTHAIVRAAHAEEEAERLDKIASDLQALCDKQALDGIHTCSDTCQRPMCVMRRELSAAEARNAKLVEALTTMRDYGCPVCGGDCASANPPVTFCPMQIVSAALEEAKQ